MGRPAMNRMISLLLVALLLSGCASSITFKPCAGHVILDPAHAPTGWRWTPTEEDIRSLEVELDALFAKPDHRLEHPAKARIAEYYVLYEGTYTGASVPEGKVIVAKGTHVSQMSFAAFQRENAPSDTIRMDVFGGGSGYFTAYYDPATKKIFRASFNAAL